MLEQKNMESDFVNKLVKETEMLDFLQVLHS